MPLLTVLCGRMKFVPTWKVSDRRGWTGPPPSSSSGPAASQFSAGSPGAVSWCCSTWTGSCPGSACRRKMLQNGEGRKGKVGHHWGLRFLYVSMIDSIVKKHNYWVAHFVSKRHSALFLENWKSWKHKRSKLQNTNAVWKQQCAKTNSTKKIVSKLSFEVGFFGNIINN